MFALYNGRISMEFFWEAPQDSLYKRPSVWLNS